MNQDWLEQAKEVMANQTPEEAEIVFERLQALGMIDDKGDVTGHLHRWDADLAVTAVKRSPRAKKIAYFRCLKPVFGMPGTATIDISRDSLEDYVKQNKKVITAHWDGRLEMWKEGKLIQLTASGYLRTDSNGEAADDLGNLPDFAQVRTGM